VNERDWQRLTEGYETSQLLDAVDALDEARGVLGDDEHGGPPRLRTNLLRLHGLAMDVVGEGFVSKAAGMFDLADDLALEVSGVLEALERVQGALERLVELRPNQLEEEDA
jgi:hypothetical protein